MVAQMKPYVQMFRVKHYFKNGLVFLPLFFSRQLLDGSQFLRACSGAAAFCFMSSAVYIFNDLRDAEKDRQHSRKKYRPIASGAVSVLGAAVCMAAFVLLSIFLSVLTGNLRSLLPLLGYGVINILYSLGLKDKPLIDIVILAAGFTIRVVYGAMAVGVAVSDWMYLTVLAASFYMGLGKRRNELKREGNGGETRVVLKHYTYDFLDKNMYVNLALVNTFYALWTMQMNEGSASHLILTVPIVTVLLMRYSLDVEGDSDGDPIEVILNDRVLISLAALYLACLVLLLYVF